MSPRALLHSALRRMKEAEAGAEVAATAAVGDDDDISAPQDDRRQLLQQHNAAMTMTTTTTTTTTALVPKESRVVAASDGKSLSVGSRGGDGGGGSRHDDCIHTARGNGSGAITCGDRGVPGAPPPAPLGSDPSDDTAAVGTATTATSSSLVREALGGEEREEHQRGITGAGIEMEDLEAALDGFSAESLRGAGLFRSSVEWGDVGGLRGVRAELREILEVRYRG